ncbi:C6 transcription factor [Colletotrichum musicola]|uniref:C6 transcription factor n=1 Tax=Colletotrichum musicola TaxID=2175873 RepID=A0A8H6K4H9_9PEZI|nr:C6 transcription factor [Colletotrichum musicola]
MERAKAFREIRPAVSASRSSSSPSSASIVASNVLHPLPSLRRPVLAACQECRRRKKKCDAGRPKCTRCRDKSLGCSYEANPEETHKLAQKRKFTEAQQGLNAHKELYSALQSMSEGEAAGILRRIRQGASAEELMTQIRDGDLLLQLALVPDARLRRYDFPFLSAMPAFLLTPDNALLRSRLYAATLSPAWGALTPSSPSSSLSSSSTAVMPVAAAVGSSSPEESGSPAAEDLQSVYLKPFHAVEMIDPRFSKIEARRWTSVVSDDGLVQKLLGAYFLHSYLEVPPFQKDYFLDDMVAGSDELCSPVLVNAVLGLGACCCLEIEDRSHFWAPHTLLYRFTAEAKRLWEIECADPSLTTVQAGILLTRLYNVSGLDKVGRLYLNHSIYLAEKMGLFEGPKEEDDQRTRKAKLFTAWAVYNFSTHCTFYLIQRPLVEKPPRIPLPDPEANPSWYGEIRIRYPASAETFPIYLGPWIKATFDLRALLNEVGPRIHEALASPSTVATLDEVKEFKDRLEKWHSRLPVCLSLDTVVFPHHIKLHLEYFTSASALHKSLLATMPPGDASKPALRREVTIVEAHFETLLRLYYLRHSFDIADSWLMYFLIYLGNKACDQVKQSALAAAETSSSSSPETNGEQDVTAFNASRSTLVLCAKGLHDVGRSIHIAAIVGRALRGRMRQADVDLLSTHANLKELEVQDRIIRTQSVLSDFALPAIDTGADRERAVVGRWLERPGGER